MGRTIMSDSTFRALLLRQDEEGKTVGAVERLGDRDLPAGDVLVAVEYSTVNYKDALAVTGRGKIVRQWPMVPGIDLAGTVVESESTDYRAGDRVVLTGWGVGERYWGGYAQRQRVKAEWLVPIPPSRDARWAMSIGTAGFTAMLCVMELEDTGVRPESGTVLVTGATGGVGSAAVAVLAKLGYRVAALTGKADARDYLEALGAGELVGGSEWSEPPRPLDTQRWAGAVDTLGSVQLARVLSQVSAGGAVAACGLAAGFDLPATVMPFILRGVRLIGVDSVMCPAERRRAAWRRLAADLPDEALAQMTDRSISLAEVPGYCDDLLGRRVKGRVLVNVNA
jgi:acrylyl-CoA reductase (NADPH)